jgi:WS/DGAT/MGAT family acyltransferase
MYVIEGLDNVEDTPQGCFAVLTKIHHAAIDGVSGSELVAAIHDIEPQGGPAPPEKPWVPERKPSLIEMGIRTGINNATNPFRFARVIRRTAPGLARMIRGNPEDEVENSAPVPRTRFNGRVSPHRIVEGRAFSLDEIRDIRKHVPGATVNDVILAVCSGAMRAYLEHHGELPDESLSAMAPISVRTKSEEGSGGNVISTMSVTLHSDEPDPLERLRKIHRTTQESKATAAAVGARTMTDVSQFMPGMLAGLAARAYTRFGLSNRIRPFLNTVITNVPGPQIPLYFTGAKMVSLYGMGPVLDGMGLIHPVFSYSGKISISVTSCRDLMPDPGF